MAHIVITGANRGIGREMMLQAIARGDTVTPTARRPEATDWPAGAQPVALDVASETSQANFTTALGSHPIDLLVCNAGVLTGHGTLMTDGGEAAWRETLMTNVAGVFFSVRSALTGLLAAQSAKVAIISSQMGSTSHVNGASYAYRASKAAAVNIGLNLAEEMRPQGIAVGIYHPGWVRTDMGTDAADISAQESARGLLSRFDALNIDTTGCFETWDGRAHPL